MAYDRDAPMSYTHWAPCEDEYVRQRPRENRAQVAAALGRTLGAVQFRARYRLGLPAIHVMWTRAEVAALHECTTLSEAEARIPNKTRLQIRRKAYCNGHHLARKVPPWTDEDTATAQRLAAQGLKRNQIAAAMGRSRNAVIGRLYRLAQKDKRQC